MDNQRIMPLSGVSEDTAPYFSMIIVRLGGESMGSMTLVPDMSPAIIALNNTGADLGRRMAQFLGGAELHGYCERVSHPDIRFQGCRRI